MVKPSGKWQKGLNYEVLSVLNWWKEGVCHIVDSPIRTVLPRPTHKFTRKLLSDESPI